MLIVFKAVGEGVDLRSSEQVCGGGDARWRDSMLEGKRGSQCSLHQTEKCHSPFEARHLQHLEKHDGKEDDPSDDADSCVC